MTASSSQKDEIRHAPETRRGSSLRTHIRWGMLAVGLVPLAVLFSYGYVASRTALAEASDEHLLSVVGARRAQIQSWLRERMTDLEVIGRSPDCNALVQQSASDRQHDEVCRYLDSFKTGARDYQVLALYDSNWNWVASQSGSAAHREELVDSELKELVRVEGRPVMTQTHRHTELGIGLHGAGVLQLPGEPSVGYVVASVDLTGTFSPILGDRAGLGHTGRVMLADRQGALLLTSAGEADPGTTLDAEIVQAATVSSGTVHYRSPSGRGIFAGFTVIPEQGWILVAEMDQLEALTLLEALRRGFLVAGFVTLIGVILLSSRISGRLSAPLGDLAAAARRIKVASPYERIPVSGGQEVAEVAHALNEMLDTLERNQRQQIQASALSAVGELSSYVAHEMRNRLSSVKMNLQALERRLDSEDDFAELAGIALEQVCRTEETLSELLDFARPVEPVRESVSVESLLTSLTAQFQAEAASRKIGIELDDRAGGVTIEADRRLLDQALSNLLRNALEVTPAGGRVTLRAAMDPNGQWLHFEIDDDGPGLNGIPPEDLFRPFFTTKDRGTGLGLAQARKITELHGGRLLALAGSRGGALFRLELPSKERPV